MLFNSYGFIFAFLPLTLLGAWLLGRQPSNRPTVAWLIACSIAFYGLWNPLSLAIIAPSLLVNFGIGRWLQRLLAGGAPRERAASALLAAGIAFNLCFLGWFKYKNFLLDSVNTVFGTHWPLLATVLPLGISFITFQKIAFLVDVRAGTVKRFDAFEFLIFVFFFPQLIAGPIVHYREMVPQFMAPKETPGRSQVSLTPSGGGGGPLPPPGGTRPPRLDPQHLAVGFGLFAMGLFKKAVLADGIAPHANAVFGMAERGEPLTLLLAWAGAAAYTLQIYFDFSGYSDMAIGLARMFGIRLPANFDSPLKASSIIDFWARWHLTLTRFLTAYVYTPLVMRLTRARMAAGKPVLTRTSKTVGAFAVLVAGPTVVTMALSGLWHGAGTTFILWGLLHGAYLTINHAWRLWRPAWDKARYERVMKPLGLVLTLTAVVVAMVLFRAKTLAAAQAMLGAMAGSQGVSLPQAILVRLGAAGEWLQRLGVQGDFSAVGLLVAALLWIAALGALALAAPNTLELLGRFEPALHFKRRAQAAGPQTELRTRWALVFGVVFMAGVLNLNRISEFLYWQF